VLLCRCNLPEEAEEQFRLVEPRSRTPVACGIPGEDDDIRVCLFDQAEERVPVDLPAAV
jgi:hypothetical protein